MTLLLPTAPTPIRNGDLAFTLRDPIPDSSPQGRHVIIYQTTIKGSPAVYGTFSDDVPSAVREIVLPGGRQPYCHQVEAAAEFLGAKRNLLLATPTASGKTVSFLTPALTTLFADPAATALFIYPMNALATDQLKALVGIGFREADNGLYELRLAGTIVRAGVLTGETAAKSRGPLREGANILITNTVALHHAILAQCNRKYADGSSWSNFLANLKILVLDEAHSYQGVSGTHVAMVIHRLNALVRQRSGFAPRAILASATIGNPLEHARNLTGLDGWALVDRSGAACHQRDVFMALPLPHPRGLGRWAASLVAQDIAYDEFQAGRRVLIFCPSRNTTEKIVSRLNDDLGADTAVYFHAALPTEVKRELLQGILKGNTRIVASTSALELGMDIGGMDTVILVGHPGDNASYNQRAGRVGRTSPGRVFLVLDELQHPLNNYLAGNPEALYWPPESRTVYPDNRRIATLHAACCLLETKDGDLAHQTFPNVVDADVLEAMATSPYKRIDPVGGGNFGKFRALEPDGKVIQELPGEAALFNWHVGATLRNFENTFFRVTKVNIKEQKVRTRLLEEAAGCRIYTTPQILTEKYAKQETLVPLVDLPPWGIEDAVAGEFDVVRTTIAYAETMEGPKSSGPNQVQIFHLDPADRNPPLALLTRGIQFTLGEGHPLAIALHAHHGGLQAAQEVLGRAVSLLIKARAEDVPVELSADGDAVRVFAFDMVDGGMGWAEQLAGKLDKWLIAAGQGLLNCPCKLKGCPRCSLSPIVGEDRRLLGTAMVAHGRARKP